MCARLKIIQENTCNNRVFQHNCLNHDFIATINSLKSVLIQLKFSSCFTKYLLVKWDRASDANSQKTNVYLANIFIKIKRLYKTLS